MNPIHNVGLEKTAFWSYNTESGTRLDILGYVVDLTVKTVSIPRKNFLNTLYGFLHIDLLAPAKLKTAQRLASWGSRYCMICRVMRPFCGALHCLSHRCIERNASFLQSAEAKEAIRRWRAMLHLVHFDETRFSRPLFSFSDPPVCIVEFDASLKGAGVVWWRRDGSTEECVGVSAIDLHMLNFGDDSSFQSTSEYIGAI